MTTFRQASPFVTKKCQTLCHSDSVDLCDDKTPFQYTAECRSVSS